MAPPDDTFTTGEEFVSIFGAEATGAEAVGAKTGGAEMLASEALALTDEFPVARFAFCSSKKSNILSCNPVTPIVESNNPLYNSSFTFADPCEITSICSLIAFIL
jgi:hypothetical protein